MRMKILNPEIKNLGTYLQHFIFFVTNKPNELECLSRASLSSLV
jgi:hypothetical protein